MSRRPLPIPALVPALLRTLPLALAVALLVAPPLAAQSVPTTINYQGRLLQNTSAQDAVAGTVDIDFSIWSGPATDGGAVELWSESWAGVALSNGIFSVLLGSNGSPLDPADFQGDPSLYLQLEIDGEVLLPRQQLGSAPFAMADEPANELQDLELTGDTLGLSNSAVTVDLSPYLDDSDEQDLTLNGTVLSLTNDPTPVDLSGFLDNTDVQTLSLTGDTLGISNSGSSVDLGAATSVVSLASRVTTVETGLGLTVFVTSSSTRGNFGGLAGGDAICQTRADGAGLRGTYRAWLSDSTGSPASRFSRGARGYFLVDGTKVADDWNDLTDGTLDHPIDRDETGALVANAAWTGTDPDGTPATGNPSGDHCVNWTSMLGGPTGTVGSPATTAAGWTDLAAVGCSSSARLYCFEQLAASGPDDQQLTLVGNDLTLTSDDGPDVVSLAGFLDNTDNQQLSLLGTNLRLTSDDGTDIVSLAGFVNTDNQNLASVLSFGNNASGQNLTNVGNIVATGLDCPNCVQSADIAQDTIGGNDIQDNIFILHIDCEGSCADMSMRDACNVIENLRGLTVEVELIGVSCVHGIPSTTGNGFVPCDDGSTVFAAMECRAFNLRTLGDLPCINGTGTDVIVTCLQTDIPK